MFSKKLKPTVFVTVLMAFAVYHPVVLFSESKDFRDSACGTDLTEEFKDSKQNIVSGCSEYKGNQLECEGASLTLTITESVGCTLYAEGRMCTEKNVEVDHGTVTCEWTSVEMTTGTGEVVIVTSCNESTHSEQSEFKDCDDREMTDDEKRYPPV